MPIRPLFHGVRVVVVVAADVGLPDTGTALAHVRGFEVLTHDHVQVAVRARVEGARGDLVGGADHPGHHINGTIHGVHPDAVAVVVTGACGIDPSGPTHGDGVDHQGLCAIVRAQVEPQDVRALQDIG